MNDEDFPLELVYEHFARLAVDGWEQATAGKTVAPMLFSVAVEDGTIVNIMPHPVELFFRHADAMDRLGMLLDFAVPKLPEEMCMVLVSEAWVKAEMRAPGEPRPLVAPKGSLADDPEARECVLINLYRPTRTRIGRLMRAVDGKLAYAPLDDDILVLGGRLIPEPGPGSAPVN